MRNPPSLSASAFGLAPALRTTSSVAGLDGSGYREPYPPVSPAPMARHGASDHRDDSPSGGTLPAKRREEVSLDEQDERARIFAARLGARLRAARRRKRLSLLAVEKLSNEEFRASVLGAYERGERTISVVRLQRLARFYNLPVGRLLMGDDLGEDSEEPSGGGAQPAAGGRLTINLAELAQAEFPGKRLLSSYVHSVQVQRNDFDSPVITLRDDDGRLLAQMLSLTEDQLRRQLHERGIIPQP